MVSFKSLVVVLSAFAAVSSAQADPKPMYTSRSFELVGDYIPVKYNGCTDTGSFCTELRIKKSAAGKLVAVPADYSSWEEQDLEIPLVPTRSGVLVFKWENPEEGDCDDPGCGNLLGFSGLVYPKKVNGKWLPHAKLHTRTDYPYPEEEEAPSGEVIETSSLIKK